MNGELKPRSSRDPQDLPEPPLSPVLSPLVSSELSGSRRQGRVRRLLTRGRVTSAAVTGVGVTAGGLFVTGHAVTGTVTGAAVLGALAWLMPVTLTHLRGLRRDRMLDQTFRNPNIAPGDKVRLAVALSTHEAIASGQMSSADIATMIGRALPQALPPASTPGNRDHTEHP